MTWTFYPRWSLLATILLAAVLQLEDLCTRLERLETSSQLTGSTHVAVMFRGTFNSWLSQSMRKSKYADAHPSQPSVLS